MEIAMLVATVLAALVGAATFIWTVCSDMRRAKTEKNHLTNDKHQDFPKPRKVPPEIPMVRITKETRETLEFPLHMETKGSYTDDDSECKCKPPPG